MKNSVLIFTLMFALQVSSQVVPDSIQHKIDQADHDTSVINIYRSWESSIKGTNGPLADSINLIIEEIIDLNLSVEMSPKMKEKFLDYQAHNQMLLGKYRTYSGDREEALKYLYQSAQTYKQLDNQAEMAGSILEIGFAHQATGEYNIAMDYFQQSLRISEEINDIDLKASCENNIGIIHFRLGDFDGAIKYFSKTRDYAAEVKDTMFLGSMESNLGGMYMLMDNLDSARYFMERAIMLRKAINNESGVMGIYINLALLEQKDSNLTKALEYLFEAERISVKEQNKHALGMVYTSLGRTYNELGQYQKAISYGVKGLNLTEETNSQSELQESYKTLYNSYKKTGNYKLALEHYEGYITIRDTLTSAENREELTRQTLEYEFESQRIADSVAFAKQSELDQLSYEASLHKERNRQYLLFGAIAFFIALAGFVYVGFRRKKKDNLIIQKQKEEVEKQKVQVLMQKDIIEQAHKEITDSISYAKTIQSAILPSDDQLNASLDDHFVLYMPKDLVAGDFYWQQQLSDGSILVAVADCTGHGVPGAMVSVVCNNALNRSVREHGLTSPNEILNKCREIVLSELAKDGSAVNDGMDISLIKLNGHKLEFAGAHHSVWIQRNGSFEILKGDKQPIGKFERYEDYHNHEFELAEGDSIYMFTDGVVDQFGGLKGKKLKTKNLREQLLLMSGLNMDKQKEMIGKFIDKWKGELEQVDDICILGINIK